MKKMEEIVLTDFSLYYDGMYFILWKEKRLRVYLPLDMLLQMIEAEGITKDEIACFLKEWKPIPFKKVPLVFEGYEKNGKFTLATSDFSECYLEESSLTLFDVNLK